MVPNQNLGIQMKLTRRALKQSGAGLAAALRRDMASTIAAELDNAAFNAAGSPGEPEGVLTNSTYNITSPAASATCAGFRTAVARFMSATAVGSPSLSSEAHTAEPQLLMRISYISL